VTAKDNRLFVEAVLYRYPCRHSLAGPTRKIWRENFFAQLKQYRAIATRYDKLARNFLSAIYLAAAVIWLN
jgi:transposase